jgi:transposase
MPRKRNALGILESPAIVSGMDCNGWRSPGKKTLGYKERDERKRQAYLCLHERYRRQGKEFVYVDESGFAPDVTRRYAYAPKGQRVYGLVSGQRRPRTSLIAARIGPSLQAPLLFEGSCTTALFTAWLAQELCPQLHSNPGVVMDNAAFHKSALTQALITGIGATLLFLPPYSPDLNPIEHDFATLKRQREYRDHESLDTLVQTYQSFGA